MQWNSKFITMITEACQRAGFRLQHASANLIRARRGKIGIVADVLRRRATQFVLVEGFASHSQTAYEVVDQVLEMSNKIDFVIPRSREETENLRTVAWRFVQDVAQEVFEAIFHAR